MKNREALQTEALSLRRSVNDTLLEILNIQNPNSPESQARKWALAEEAKRKQERLDELFELGFAA